MTADIARLRLVLRANGHTELEGWTAQMTHLQRCGRSQHRETCPECSMHVLTPEVMTLLDINDDITALNDTPLSLAAVIAIAELSRLIDEVALDNHHATGVRSTAHLLLTIVTDHHRALCDNARRVLSTGAALAQTLQHSACTLAVPRLLAGIAGIDNPPAAVRRGLQALDQLADAARLANVVLGEIDRETLARLPLLATQPEWTCLSARSRITREPVHELEALVAESIADELLQLVTAVATSLAAMEGRSVITRPHPASAMRSRTRTLVWRRATMNWALSVADTGLASCWSSKLPGPETLRVVVPVGPALGLETGLPGHTLFSALHGGNNGGPCRPSRRPA